EEVVLAGRPLLARAWNAVAPVADRVMLQGAASAPPGLVPSPDERRGEGPLAGLETILKRTVDEGRDAAAVLAVDLPRVPASLLLSLLRRWREMDGSGTGAVIVDTGEGLQPLAGIYGAGLARHLTSWLDGGSSRAVHAWIEALGDRVVPVSLSGLEAVAGVREPLLNVNRPEELLDAGRLPAPLPPAVSVVGWKDSGKTSTAVALVDSLQARGWRVMALKHGHGFRLDTEGTDSARLREAGAERAVLAGPDGFAVLGGWGRGGEPPAPALATRFLSGADVVVVEGWKHGVFPAIEVVGPEGREPPLWHEDAPDRDRFLARVVPDGGPGTTAGPLTLDRGDPTLGDGLADLVEERVFPGWRS
ncbi:MAG: molybdopterin-guanine dinucleotide biosynthesis protein B, partial [Gemmatimonadota bacterium]